MPRWRNFSGTASGDRAVVSTFAVAFDAGIYDSELELRIGWLSGNEWTPVGAGPFVNDAWNSGSIPPPGTCGMDMGNNVVLVVTGHNSEFAVIPEPITWMLLGLCVVFALRVGNRPQISPIGID